MVKQGHLFGPEKWEVNEVVVLTGQPLRASFTLLAK